MSQKLIINPRTGTPYFGLIGKARARGLWLPEAPIILRLGRQSARGGFGARHIWAIHLKEIQQAGYKTFADVPHFVAKIITPGSPVHYEGLTKFPKVTVVRSDTGIAILQFDDAKQVYSVTTAYAARSAHGIRIGKVLDYIEPSPEAEKAKRPQGEPVGV